MNSSMPMDMLLERFRTLERQVRWHRRLGAGAIVAVSVVLSMGLQAPTDKPRFTEIDVERLNVVEPDGQLVLSMANTARLPQPILDGKVVNTSRTGPGLIFFDGKGWEVGGLIYGTNQKGDTGTAYAHLSFDQYHGDQVVYLHHEGDSQGSRNSSGLHVVDREPGMQGKGIERVFVGSLNDHALIRLRDLAGRDRIRLVVDPAGDARLEILDASGKVVTRLPS